MNESASAIRLRMPVEHGAWGLFLVPLLCAAILAEAWNPALALGVVLTLALFLLRGSVEAHRALPGSRWALRAIMLAAPHVLLLTGAVASGLALLFVNRRMQLLPLGALALLLFALQQILVRQHQQRPSEKRSLMAELVGVALLSLAAPAAWISARGALDAAGARVWLLNLLFFLGGVLYVKYRVRGVLAHREFGGLAERVEFAWPVFAYHALLGLFILVLVLQKSLSAAVLAAFAPGMLRAGGLLFHLGRRFPIRRLGWTEVGHSVLFAVLLILAFRLS
jgi:hypothetical protein